MSVSYTLQIIVYHILMLSVVELLLRAISSNFQKTGRPCSLLFLFSQCVWGVFSALLLATVIGFITHLCPSGQRFAEGLFFEGGLFLFLAALKFRTENIIFHSRKVQELREASASTMQSQPQLQSQLSASVRFVFIFLIFFAVSWIGIGLYSLYYEPWNLQVKTYRVESPLVKEPIRVVLIADPQSDAVGDYELRAFELAKEQKGDLILFGGDYLQYDRGKRDGAYKELNIALKKSAFHAPMGVYAVNGNIDDGARWAESFEGTGIKTYPESRTVFLQKNETKIALTLLTIDACRSFNSKEIIEESFAEAEKNNVTPQEQESLRLFHIILGHDPSLVWNGTGADLILSGHTHGGQCCIPGWGLIFAPIRRIPLAWALGRHELPDGATLIVSNGIGMERSAAPRIRFWCPPQIVVVEIVPTP